ncbi:MAG: hypothetical protein EPO21_01995 [Chloroflexota bacterium]|nr:MAG: hypothetical protein EPO21_01995 [Chloroflexota bacterium]
MPANNKSQPDHPARRVVSNTGLLVVLAAVLLGVVLRLYKLGEQSFWLDEGLGMFYARPELSALFALLVGGNHPPLYFLLVHFWYPLAGESEYALRYLSVFFGVLTLPLVYQVARRFTHTGWLVGLVAVAMAALSPMFVWYSQESRMYTLMTFLAVLSAYQLLRLTDRLETQGKTSWIEWLVYGVVCALAIYAHYYAALAVLFEGVYFGVWLLARMFRRGEPLGAALRPLLFWVPSQIVAVLLYSPWLAQTGKSYEANDTYWWGTIELSTVVEQTVKSFAVGDTLLGSWGTWGSLAWAGLAGLGLLWILLRPNRLIDRVRSLFLLLWLAVPILGIYGIVANRPKFAARYLMPSSLAFYVLAALGLVCLLVAVRRRPLTYLSRPVGLGLAGLALGPALFSLGNTYFVEDFARDDLRSVAAYIRQHEQAGDTVVVLGGHLAPAFQYYYRGPLALSPVPDKRLPTLTRPLGNEVIDDLNAITRGKQRLWLVLWQDQLVDPRGIVLEQLMRNCQRLEVGQLFHGLNLLLFSLDGCTPLKIATQMDHALAANFGDQMSLEGFSVDPPVVQSGQPLRVTLFWHGTKQMEEDYTVFIHLLNPRNHIYGQIDKHPINDYFPTSHWRSGESMEDAYTFQVLPGTPPGQYELEIGVYRTPSMERLPVLDEAAKPVADRVVLTQVQVTPAQSPPTDPVIPHPLDLALTDELTLKGYGIEPTTLPPGGYLHYTLLWQKAGTSSENRRLRLRLLNERGQTIAEQLDDPTDGVYPTGQWQPNQIVRHVGAIQVPAEARGTFQVELSVTDKDGHALGSAESGSFRLPEKVSIK